MSIIKRSTTTNGHDLFNEVDAAHAAHKATLAEINERAAAREDDIAHRLTELEAEARVLRKTRALASA